MAAMKGRTLLSARVLAGIVVLAAGCGKKAEPTPVPIKGRVEFGNARPATRLLLTLYPTEEANKRNKRDALLLGEKDGSFEGSCLPGHYKATLTAVPVQGGNPAAAGGVVRPGVTPSDPSLQSLAPCTQVGTTPLEIDVPEGGKTDLLLTVNVPGG